MDTIESGSFLNVSNMDLDKAQATIIDQIVVTIRTTELENKTRSVQLVSELGDVLEFFSAIPAQNSATPNGAKLTKDEVIELFGYEEEILSVIYDYVVEKYPGISVTKAPGKKGVFFFCPRFVMLVHEYQSPELLAIAEQRTNLN